MLDSNSIIANCDMLDVLQRAGFTLDEYNSKKLEPNGNHCNLLCIYHNDHNSSGTSLIVHQRSDGTVFKGMHCFVCNKTVSLAEMVADKMGWDIVSDYPKILEFIAGGKEASKMYENGISSSKLLNIKELETIGLCFNQLENIAYDDVSFVDKTNKQKKIFTLNSNSLNGKPTYNNFMDFINQKPAIKKENKFFTVEYGTPVRNPISLQNLYCESPKIYKNIVRDAANSKEKEVKELIANFKEVKTKEDAKNITTLKKQLKGIQEIKKKIKYI